MILLFSEHNPRKKTLKKAIVFLLGMILIAAAVIFGRMGFLYLRYRHYRASDPAAQNAVPFSEGYTMTDGDLYVSTTGDDGAAGTKDAPFRTIEKAVAAVRGMDKPTAAA